MLAAMRVTMRRGRFVATARRGSCLTRRLRSSCRRPGLAVRCGRPSARLLVLAGELLLAGDGVEFRFRGAGAKGANPNAVRPHLFGKSLCKQKVEGFCCRVGGDVRHSLEGSGGSEDQDITAAPGDHIRQIQPRKMNHGRQFTCTMSRRRWVCIWVSSPYWPKPALLISRSISRPCCFVKA